VTLERPELQPVLFGPGDVNLRTIRETFDVQMFARGGSVKITGAAGSVSKAAAVLSALQRRVRRDEAVTPQAVADAISSAARSHAGDSADAVAVYNARLIKPRSAGQRRYVQSMRKHDMVFCMGPAGTGKTYLAVAVAVNMLKTGMARRMALARPAVEAGEKLGFLPGDLQAKVNPYLRPLFDALHDMMEFEQVRRFMDNDIIEVIPLAFMRGRTFNESIIILDEAQNTTPAQMLMFLTRLGHGSKMIITGDDSQIDLPTDATSGLIDAQRRLKGIKGLIFVRLDRNDIVRHRLVQNVVLAYAEEWPGGAPRVEPVEPAKPADRTEQANRPEPAEQAEQTAPE